MPPSIARDRFATTLILYATALLAATAGIAGPAPDPAAPNRAAVEAEGITPAGVAGAALELADFGRAENDPMILIAAARALRLAGETPGTGTLSPGPDVPDDVKPAAAAEGGDTVVPAENRDLAAELLDEARLMARGDATVLAAIDAAGASATRGSVTGAGRYNVPLAGRSGATITEKFRGIELAEVTMIGDGRSDLDLAIIDQNGNTICTQSGPEPNARCRWTPAWEGPFEIRVLNTGQMPSAAVVLVN